MAEGLPLRPPSRQAGPSPIPSPSARPYFHGPDHHSPVQFLGPCSSYREAGRGEERRRTGSLAFAGFYQDAPAGSQPLVAFGSDPAVEV